jgi:hypothetical protein
MLPSYQTACLLSIGGKLLTSCMGMGLCHCDKYGLLTAPRSWFAGGTATDLETTRTHLWPGNGG